MSLFLLLTFSLLSMFRLIVCLLLWVYILIISHLTSAVKRLGNDICSGFIIATKFWIVLKLMQGWSTVIHYDYTPLGLYWCQGRNEVVLCLLLEKFWNSSSSTLKVSISSSILADILIVLVWLLLFIYRKELFYYKENTKLLKSLGI